MTPSHDHLEEIGRIPGLQELLVSTVTDDHGSIRGHHEQCRMSNETREIPDVLLAIDQQARKIGLGQLGPEGRESCSSR